MREYDLAVARLFLQMVFEMRCPVSDSIGLDCQAFKVLQESICVGLDSVPQT